MPEETTSTETGGQTTDTGTTETETTTSTEQLGEAGQRALDRMKAELKDTKAKARRADELEAELAQLREQHQSDAEKALGAARKEGADEATKALAPELTELRIKVAVLESVGGKLADPADALRFLDPAEVLDKDGSVDTQALAKAIDELLEAKPYLAAGATPGTTRIPAGARGGTDGADDMNALLRRSAGLA